MQGKKESANPLDFNIEAVLANRELFIHRYASDFVIGTTIRVDGAYAIR